MSLLKNIKNPKVKPLNNNKYHFKYITIICKTMGNNLFSDGVFIMTSKVRQILNKSKINIPNHVVTMSDFYTFMLSILDECIINLHDELHQEDLDELEFAQGSIESFLHFDREDASEIITCDD